MSRRALQLVASEHHVERALAGGFRATTWGTFLRRTVLEGLRLASRETTLLATALAMEGMASELGGAPGTSLALALDATVGSLRRAGVHPSELLGLAKPRAALLARVLADADARLCAAGLYDERALGFRAARAIAAIADDDLPSRVEIDGLLQWDAAHCAWVEALAKRVPVTVRLPRSSDVRFVELGRAVDLLLSGLEARWQQSSDAPDLELFAAALPAQVRLIEAGSDAAEARAVVGVVSEELAAGVAPERIAVLLPSLDEAFLEPLRAAFDEAQVAFGEPRGKPPNAAPAVQAALTWLEVISAPLHRNGCIELLQLDAVDPAPFIDGSTRAARRRRALLLVQRFARMPVGSDPDGALMLDVIRDDVDRRPDLGWMCASVERLVGAVRSVQGEASRGEILAHLTRAWSAMGLVPTDLDTITAWVQTPADVEAGLLARSLRERAAGLRALASAAERVVSAAVALGVQAQPVTPARFRAELIDALDHVAPEATTRPACVRLVRAGDVAGLSTDVLIATRASEGAFVPLPTEGALLGDDVREAFAPGRRPQGTPEIAAARTAELLACLSATRRLVLTRSRADADGRPLSAAVLFTELATGAAIESEPASFLHADSPLSPRVRELVLLSRHATPPEGDVARRVEIELERARFFADPSHAPGPASGLVVLGDEGASEHLQATVGGTAARPIAATAIERAAQCRFAAFASRVLGAGGDDELGEGLAPWQRGSLIHRGLHAAFEAVGPSWDQLPRAEIMARAAEAARQSLLSGKSSLLYQAEVERALRDVAAVVVWSLDDASAFRFTYGEVAFGGEGPVADPRRAGKPREKETVWPALVIGQGTARIRVKGRIDRVDVTRDGARARVIDYKSGAMPAWKDVGTLWFQPALYAHAVWQQLGRLSVSEMRSLYLDTSRRPPRMLPAEKSQVVTIDQIADADRVAAAVVARMWRGDVAPRPSDAAVCARCQVRDVCRRPAAMPIEELDPEGEGAP